jgi:site-specific DNA recombinase
LEQLRGVARNPVMLREVLRQLNEHRQKDSAEIERERTDTQRELNKIAQEMKKAVSIVGKADPEADLATDRLAELQDRIAHLNSRLAELRQQGASIEAEGINAEEVENALHHFDPLWEQLSTWEHERFIRTLVDQVRYDGKTGTVTLAFRSQGIKDFCNWAPALTERYEYAKCRS